MMWVYSRGSEQIRFENQYDTQTAEFVLVIEHHDGYRETKRFAEALAFRAWLSAFERQLETEQWTGSEQLRVGPRGTLDRHRESPPGIETGRDIIATTTRRYTGGYRTFELLLFERVLMGEPSWTVERVLDVSWACKVAVIPGVQAVTASTPDAAFARACDCIDKWLWKNR